MAETPELNARVGSENGSDSRAESDEPARESVTSSEAAAAPSTSNGAAGMDGALEEMRERGFITTGEIFAAFPDLEPDTDQLRDLYEMFESNGVKVLDEIAEELEREDQRRAGSAPTVTQPDVAPRREAREHRPSTTSRPGAEIG